MELRYSNAARTLAGAALAIRLFAAGNDWRPLFDGKSSEGWVEVTGKPFPPNSWTVEDACLKTVVRPGGAQDIRTVDSFRNFDLESIGRSSRMETRG